MRNLYQNHKNESDIEFNNTKINVEFNNYQFDEIKNIQLPKELQYIQSSE